MTNGEDRDCEHCAKTYGTLGCCDTVSNEWVYSCKEGHEEYARGMRKFGSTTKNNLGVDCIDRQAAITFACKNTKEILKDTMPLEVKLSVDYIYENVAKIMRNPKVLPPVTPQPRKGHWILDETDNSITCDKCGCLIWANDISNGEAYFCPNCGAKMVEE